MKFACLFLLGSVIAADYSQYAKKYANQTQDYASKYKAQYGNFTDSNTVEQIQKEVKEKMQREMEEKIKEQIQAEIDKKIQELDNEEKELRQKDVEFRKLKQEVWDEFELMKVTAKLTSLMNDFKDKEKMEEFWKDVKKDLTNTTLDQVDISLNNDNNTVSVEASSEKDELAWNMDINSGKIQEIQRTDDTVKVVEKQVDPVSLDKDSFV